MSTTATAALEMLSSRKDFTAQGFDRAGLKMNAEQIEGAQKSRRRSGQTNPNRKARDAKYACRKVSRREW